MVESRHILELIIAHRIEAQVFGRLGGINQPLATLADGPSLPMAPRAVRTHFKKHLVTYSAPLGFLHAPCVDGA